MAKIYVDKSAERGFIKRALRAYPNELLEVLWGVRRNGDIYVHSFQHIDQKDSPSVAEYESINEELNDKSGRPRFIDSLDIHFEMAEDENVSVVGKIHSHPYDHDKCDDMPSYGDQKESIRECEFVSGICMIGVKNGRRFVRVGYWKPMEKYEVKRYI